MNQQCKDIFEYYELPFETYFAKEINHTNQVHDEIELMWLIRGEATIICDNIEYHLTNQNLFMVNPHQFHSIQTSENSILITYRFKKEHLHANNLSFDNNHFPNHVYTFAELVAKYKEVPLLIAQLLKLLISNDEDKIIRYKIIGYYNMFVYELYTMLQKEKYLDVKQRNYDTYIDRINILTEYISLHFSDKLTLDELADMVHLNKYRLSHFIKEYIGISLQDYINNTRLEYALKELRTTNYKICDISKHAGFSDVKYLTKALKTKTGLTALKYRKLSKEISINTLSSSLNLDEFKKELILCLNKIDFELRKATTNENITLE